MTYGIESFDKFGISIIYQEFPKLLALAGCRLFRDDYANKSRNKRLGSFISTLKYLYCQGLAYPVFGTKGSAFDCGDRAGRGKNTL